MHSTKMYHVTTRLDSKHFVIKGPSLGGLIFDSNYLDFTDHKLIVSCFIQVQSAALCYCHQIKSKHKEIKNSVENKK